MVEYTLMVLGISCAVVSFVLLEVYRIGMSAKQLTAIRQEVFELGSEISRLRVTIEENEQDHLIMRQMIDSAISACKRH